MLAEAVAEIAAHDRNDRTSAARALRKAGDAVVLIEALAGWRSPPAELTPAELTLRTLIADQLEGGLPSGEELAEWVRDLYLDGWGRTLADDWGDVPPPVLSRMDEGGEVKPLLPAGTAALVADQSSKRDVATRLALAAAAGVPEGADLDSHGLRIAAGRAVIVNGEELGEETVARLRERRKSWGLDASADARVRVIGSGQLGGPLWRGPDAGEQQGPTEALHLLEALCARERATVLVIDHAPTLLADTLHDNDGTVRDFVRYLVRVVPRGIVVLVAPRVKPWRAVVRHVFEDDSPAVVLGSVTQPSRN